MEGEQITQVRLDRIRSKEHRKKWDARKLRRLADSINEVGLLQPIRLQPCDNKEYTITVGEHRVQAFRILGRETIASIVEGQPLGLAESVQRQLIENCARENLTPMEKARAYETLRSETDWSVIQIAEKVATSAATVSRLLALLSLSPEIQELIGSGVIAPSAAYELTRIADPLARDEAATKLAQGILTRDSLAGTNKSAARRQSPVKSSLTRAMAMLGDNRSVTVSGTGLDLEGYISTLVECLAKARKVRPQGMSLATFLKMLRDQAQGG